MLKPFMLPSEVEFDQESISDDYGNFFLAPLEKGWGHTIGNALRRALLSAVQGAAVTQVRIDGITHEFSVIAGVLEKVPDIILNLKKLRLTLSSDSPKTIRLRAKGKKSYLAKDLETPPEVEIKNPALLILTLTEAKRLVNMEMKVENGRGWLPSERLKKLSPPVPVGTIFLDAFFSPVKKVTYRVENTRVGDRIDFEKVILEIWTDRTTTPEQALIQAALYLKEHMDVIIKLGECPEFTRERKVERNIERLRTLLSRDIEDLELSYRTVKYLKDGRIRETKEPVHIRTIGDLISKTKNDMLKIDNVGNKSYAEMEKALTKWGLTFNYHYNKMPVDEIMGRKEPGETSKKSKETEEE